jgi:hypothetical protein
LAVARLMSIAKERTAKMTIYIDTQHSRRQMR